MGGQSHTIIQVEVTVRTSSTKHRVTALSQSIEQYESMLWPQRCRLPLQFHITQTLYLTSIPTHNCTLQLSFRQASSLRMYDVNVRRV